MSTPILHGGSKFRQGVLQLMIHSIDPLYEEPLNMAYKNGQELGKDHVHPPGAAYCPICGEEKHVLKLNTNGVFHTTQTLMSNNSSGNLPEEAVMSTHNGNLSRQDSFVRSELLRDLHVQRTVPSNTAFTRRRRTRPSP